MDPGPLQLKQFAAYTPGTNTTKGKREGSTARRRRFHQHLDKHARASNKKREKIYATIDGQIVSWDASSPTPAAHVHDEAAGMVTATIDGEVQTWVNNWVGPSTSTATSQPSTALSQGVSEDVSVAAKLQKTCTQRIPQSNFFNN